jgi:hypothetical protein
MSNPAAFIDEHIEEFGILGTNNVVPDENGNGEALPSCSYEFTKGNHFRFGFGAGEFNRRRSQTDKYWVEIGRPSRPHKGFVAEMARAIAEIYEMYGPFTVSNSGTELSRAAVAVAKDLGIRFEEITIAIKGFPAPPPDEGVTNHYHEITWDEFSKFAVEFCSIAGCSQPWVALQAYHGVRSERAHVYPLIAFFLHNHNWDNGQHIVGPPNWSYIEQESFTAINRWLLATGRKGVVQILGWSPELMAARLDSKVVRDRVREVSSAPPSALFADLRAKLDAIPSLLLDAYPNLRMTTSSLADSKDPELASKVQALRRRLRNANPGRNAAHAYPLHRLLEDLGVRYNFNFGQTQETYGHVGVQ